MAGLFSTVGYSRILRLQLIALLPVSIAAVFNAGYQYLAVLGANPGLAGDDLRSNLANALGGAMYVTGEEVDPPVRLAGFQALITASTFAAVSSMIEIESMIMPSANHTSTITVMIIHGSMPELRNRLSMALASPVIARVRE